MPLVIPVNGELPHTRFEVQLDGRTFGLEFRWNERAAAWFMSVYAADGTLLIVRKVVLGWRLLARFRDTRLPFGEFVAIDTTKSNVEPGFKDLGGRVQLLYLTADELAEEAA